MGHVNSLRGERLTLSVGILCGSSHSRSMGQVVRSSTHKYASREHGVQATMRTAGNLSTDLHVESPLIIPSTGIPRSNIWGWDIQRLRYRHWGRQDPHRMRR